MSAPDRKAIDLALYARLASIAGLATTSRDLVGWDAVDRTQQPAGYQCAEDEDVTPAGPVGGGRSAVAPSHVVLRRVWYLYVHRGTCAAATGEAVLSDALDVLLDRATAALRPPVGQMAQTLGGLVADCRIAGTITRDGGVLGDQAVAVIPLELTV